MSLPTVSSTNGGRMEAGSLIAAITAVSQVGQLARSRPHPATSRINAKQANLTGTSEKDVIGGAGGALRVQNVEESGWNGALHLPKGCARVSAPAGMVARDGCPTTAYLRRRLGTSVAPDGKV